MSDDSAITNRSISQGIAAGVLVFAVLVSAGTYLRMRAFLPAGIILGCTLAFLLLWYRTRHQLVRRRQRPAGEMPSVDTRFQFTGGAAVVLAIFAWILALTGDLVTITSSRVALLLLLATALSSLTGFMLAVISISDPAPRRGKGLGILAAAALGGLVLLAAVRLLFGL